jgi:glycosyltransferase involved in cell wall biosynthesis
MILHIVEPTLNSYAGHCHSLVEALVQAAPVEQVRIWAGTGSEKFWQGPGQLEPYFFRFLRKFQAFLLYRRLLRQPGKVLLSTAGTIDLITLDLAAKGPIPASKVYLYIHWVGAKASKAAKLGEIARHQPNLQILCATPSGTAFFRGLGFRALTVPYPRNILLTQDDEVQPFSHLVVAGAARSDKGFDKIVDLVEDFARSRVAWPIVVQASASHHDKHTPEILGQIDRLEGAGYAHLTLKKTTLTPADYQALFPGGISVQPYSEGVFQDRVSGVTLDALSAGCPVIVTANTWLARTISQYQAGVATNDLSPAGLQLAIEQVLSDYSGYARRAASAGRELHSQHSARAMMEVIFETGRSAG